MKQIDKISLTHMQRKALVIANSYDGINRLAGRKTWDLNDYMDGLVGDIGDLMKALMAVRNRRKMSEAEKKVEHELADVMFSILLLYKFFQLDPAESFMKQMAVLEERLSSEAKQ
ncbi:MAG: hypothetical protein ACREGD_02040 [Candidatus Saccharimonadales bacterium]